MLRGQDPENAGAAKKMSIYVKIAAGEVANIEIRGVGAIDTGARP